MKKHILKVLLLCSAILFLNCQNDDRQFEEEAMQQPIFKEIGFKELQRFPKAVEEIQRLGLKGENLHSRTVYDSVNDFTIHTDKILLVEFNNYHWITFPISRDYPTDATENIILRYNMELNLYNVFLVEYQFTSTEKENIALGIYPDDILQRANLMLLENFDTSLLNRSGSTSDPIKVDANGDCYSIDRIFEVDGKAYFTAIDVPCPPGMGNNQGGPTQQPGNNQGPPSYIPPTSTDPATGTDSGSNVVVYPGGTGANYVYTPPVRVPAHQLLPTKPLVLNPIIKEVNHIFELNKITNRPEVKTKVMQLKAEVTTFAMEQGSEFFTDENESLPLIQEDLTPELAGIHFGDVFPNSILRIHSHDHPALEPVFSSDDVYKMAEFYKDKRQFQVIDAENISSILVSNLGIFALRVTDPVKAKVFADKFFMGSYLRAFKQDYDRSVRMPAYKACNCADPNNVLLQKNLSNNLIDFLTRQNTGLTLYQATVNADGSLSWNVAPKMNLI